MAKASYANMKISELESILEKQRSKLGALLHDRARIQGELERVDREIAGMGGSASASNGVANAQPKRRGRPPKSASSASGGRAEPGSRPAAGKRARNEKSLVATLTEVLEKKPEGMSITDIVDAVKASGYQSSSPNFRGIVNQTLIRERKKFDSVSRGTYSLTK